jgi:hypothetical protein
MKNKISFFIAIFGFQVQVLVILIDIRTTEKTIMKKMKDYLTKKVPVLGSENNSSRIKVVKKHRIPDPELCCLFKYTVI